MDSRLQPPGPQNLWARADAGGITDSNPHVRVLACTQLRDPRGLRPSHGPIATSASFTAPPATITVPGLAELCPDVLYGVFQYLNLEDLELLRRCQQALNGLVLEYPSYHKIRKYAPGLVRTICATRMDAFHTPAAILEVLCESECAACGELGPFIFLPTLLRVCIACVSRRSFLMVPVSAARKLLDLSASQVEGIPKMLSLPKTVTQWQDWSMPDRRFWVMNTTVLYDRVAQMQSKPVQDVVTAVYDRCNNLASRSKTAYFWWKSFGFSTSPHGDRGYGHPRMAMILHPILHKQDNTLQDIMWCAGCQVNPHRDWVQPPRQHLADNAARKRDQAYTRDGFVAHINECDAAQQLLLSHVIMRQNTNKGGQCRESGLRSC